MCVPTALFITVVPAIVVAVTVPQAANAVAILAVKLVLLALSGSCRERKEERGFRGQIMSMQQKQRADTELELKKRQLSLSSEDIIFTAALTPGKL